MRPSKTPGIDETAGDRPSYAPHAPAAQRSVPPWARSKDAGTGPASSLRVPRSSKRLGSGSGPEIVTADPDGVVAILADCVLIVHCETPTTEILGAMEQAYSRAAARSGTFAHLCVIESHSQLLPPGPVRNGLGALMQRFDARIAGAAIIYEGAGFKATTLRSIVTGLCMVSRTTHRTRVFAEVASACDWVSDCLPVPGGSFALELSKAVRELRAGAQLRSPRGG